MLSAKEAFSRRSFGYSAIGRVKGGTMTRMPTKLRKLDYTRAAEPRIIRAMRLWLDIANKQSSQASCPLGRQATALCSQVARTGSDSASRQAILSVVVHRYIRSGAALRTMVFAKEGAYRTHSASWGVYSGTSCLSLRLMAYESCLRAMAQSSSNSRSSHCRKASWFPA